MDELLLLQIILIFVFGAAIGSFLNVLTLRWPNDKKASGRSGCSKCGAQLSSKELIPIVSFLILRGKCRHCSKKISIRYVLMEVSTAILFVCAFLMLTPKTLPDFVWLTFILFVIATSIVIFVIDLEYYLILDKVVIPASILALVFLVIFGVFTTDVWYLFLLNSILGIFAGAFPLFCLWFLSGGKWMGFGDVKLAGFMGVVLGFPLIILALFMAFMIGSFVSIPLLLTQKKELSSKLPFGTFLTVATVISLFYGPELLGWYLSIIGWR